MHKSRLSNIIIDCQTDDIDAAARFWAAALGRVAESQAEPSEPYRLLEGPPNEMKILVQAVGHESRVTWTSRPTTSKRKPNGWSGWVPGEWRRSRPGGSCRRPPASGSALCGRRDRTSRKTRTPGAMTVTRNPSIETQHQEG